MALPKSSATLRTTQTDSLKDREKKREKDEAP
jgi:hypothetical protein